MDRITLIGTEQVESAGVAMRRAAEEMSRAASNLSYALEEHRRWMDDWLVRMQQLFETRRGVGSSG